MGCSIGSCMPRANGVRTKINRPPKPPNAPAATTNREICAAVLCLGRKRRLISVGAAYRQSFVFASSNSDAGFALGFALAFVICFEGETRVIFSVGRAVILSRTSAHTHLRARKLRFRAAAVETQGR